MKTTPKKIKTDIEAVKIACENWLTEIKTTGNETAYSDRIIEDIIRLSENLETDYEKQFK